MKKIITVLMVLMVATSMFAETKVLFNNKIEERVAYSDTSYKQLDYEKFTSEEVLYIVNKLSKIVGGEEYKLELIALDFEKLDKYAKEYNFYYIDDSKLNRIIVFIRTDDETQAVIYYKVKPNK